MKDFLKMLLIVAASLFAGAYLHKCQSPTHDTGKEVKTVTVTRIDTISYYAPKPVSELATATQFYTLPKYCFFGRGSGGKPRCSADSAVILSAVDTNAIALARMYGTGAGGEPRCSADSAIIELPIIQRHYADSTYEAWVSGPVDPRLDSMRVFAPTTIITKREWKPPKRWHIGVTAGYGYGARGFQPYIGVGITYSICSF